MLGRRSCLLDGESPEGLPETAAALRERCRPGAGPAGGVLFTRKMPSPATAKRVAAAMAEVNLLSPSLPHSLRHSLRPLRPYLCPPCCLPRLALHMSRCGPVIAEWSVYSYR